MSEVKPKKMLLISSSGGHWIQMNRLKTAFDKEDLYFACTDAGHEPFFESGKFFFVPDASRTSGVFKILWQAFKVLLVLIKVKPQVVLTTGAAPGFFAIFFAKKMGIKTIWVDSIANAEEISMSGKKAAKHADLFITQWEDLASENGPKYFGSVV